jgi:hypothetical protein
MAEKVKFKINQIELICAISSEICKQQGRYVVPGEQFIMNTFISAANLVVDKLNGVEFTPNEIKPEPELPRHDDACFCVECEHINYKS